MTLWLMKRVLGERIEQRRKAVRAALKALGSGQTPPSDLLAGEHAFTPTGKDRITVSGVSSVTGSGLSSLSNITSPSTVGRPSSSFSGLRRELSQPQPGGLSIGSMIGYGIGALGLVLLGAYHGVAPGPGQASASSIVLAFLLGQAYLVAKLVLRLTFYAGQMALYESPKFKR